MTLIDLPATTLAPVTLDLYRDIHKAIRTELFSVTTEAASLDPSLGVARAGLARHVRDIVAFLVDHAEHEDAAIQPVLERELPDLAARVAVDHEVLEARMERPRRPGRGGRPARRPRRRPPRPPGAPRRRVVHRCLPGAPGRRGAGDHAGPRGGRRRGGGGRHPPGDPRRHPAAGHGQVARPDAPGHEHRRSHRAARRHAGRRTRPRCSTACGASRAPSSTPATWRRWPAASTSRWWPDDRPHAREPLVVVGGLRLRAGEPGGRRHPDAGVRRTDVRRRRRGAGPRRRHGQAAGPGPRQPRGRAGPGRDVARPTSLA